MMPLVASTEKECKEGAHENQIKKRLDGSPADPASD
jgi:hypothetical protein